MAVKFDTEELMNTMAVHPLSRLGNATTEWVTPSELADELKIDVQTVYLWHQKGTAPKRHRFGKHVRYTRADVEAWKAEHVVTADE
jgi:excisionase family DNA binding protein